jgi:hypothetical protein
VRTRAKVATATCSGHRNGAEWPNLRWKEPTIYIGDGRRGAVVVRAAQPKLPPAKMVDSKYPSVGYHYGSSWRRGRNAFARGEWVLTQARLSNSNRGPAVQMPHRSAGPLRLSGRLPHSIPRAKRSKTCSRLTSLFVFINNAIRFQLLQRGGQEDAHQEVNSGEEKIQSISWRC